MPTSSLSVVTLFPIRIIYSHYSGGTLSSAETDNSTALFISGICRSPRSKHGMPERKASGRRNCNSHNTWKILLPEGRVQADIFLPHLSKVCPVSAKFRKIKTPIRRKCSTTAENPGSHACFPRILGNLARVCSYGASYNNFSLNISINFSSFNTIINFRHFYCISYGFPSSGMHVIIYHSLWNVSPNILNYTKYDYTF